MLSHKLVENSILQWKSKNKIQCNYAENTQQLAEVAIDEAEQAGLECVERAAVGKRQVNQHLEDRIEDLQFRFSELDLQKKKLEDELAELHTVHKRVEEAQNKCREPLHITTTCITQRKERERVELVQDPVSRNLILEEAKIIETQMKLTALTHHLNEQVRLLRAAIYSVNKDTTGKEFALGIDKLCVRLSDMSSSLQDELELNNRKKSTEAEWDSITRSNLMLANNQIRKSRELRSRAEIVLRAVCENICKAYDRTNQSFEKRIFETKIIKTKLENELAETTRQANDVKNALIKIELPIKINKDHMSLAITRISERERRPGVEKCNDAVERQLYSELRELQTDAENLNKRRQQADASLKALQRSLQLLTQELEMKTQSLLIDEVQCMTQRLSMNFHNY